MNKGQRRTRIKAIRRHSSYLDSALETGNIESAKTWIGSIHLEVLALTDAIQKGDIS